MRKLFESVRASRWPAFAVVVLILLLAVAPAAWSRTGTAQQRQVAVGVLEVDDCKQGNWQRYRVFKNQGDCVSYVASGGRNQPSGQTRTTQPAPTTTTIATNRPGSKEDCKDGGWANYGFFKNQGDCVSYVVTGGTNQPSGQTSTTPRPTTTTQPAPTTTTIATNRPGSKEDCKDGGWANYGVFKNQGDCVSYVATGGTNPPDGA